MQLNVECEIRCFLIKGFGGRMMPLFLFIFFIFFITYIHSYNHIYPSPFAGASLHLPIACQLSGRNLPVVPSRESNSGLPHSMPTRYPTNWATPHHNWATPHHDWATPHHFFSFLWLGLKQRIKKNFKPFLQSITHQSLPPLIPLSFLLVRLLLLRKPIRQR